MSKQKKRPKKVIKQPAKPVEQKPPQQERAFVPPYGAYIDAIQAPSTTER